MKGRDMDCTVTVTSLGWGRLQAQLWDQVVVCDPSEDEDS